MQKWHSSFNYIQKELDAVEANNNWELTVLLAGSKVIGPNGLTKINHMVLEVDSNHFFPFTVVKVITK